VADDSLEGYVVGLVVHVATGEGLESVVGEAEGPLGRGSFAGHVRKMSREVCVGASWWLLETHRAGNWQVKCSFGGGKREWTRKAGVERRMCVEHFLVVDRR